MIPSYVGMGAIPGADTATNWIKAQVGAFYMIPLRLSKAVDLSLKLHKTAGDKGIKTEQLRAYGVTTALASLKDSFDKAEVKLSSLLTGMKSAGLGDIPIGLALSAIPLSASMLYIFKTMDYQEKVLEDVKRRVLSPGEISSMKGGGFNFGSPAIILIGLATAGFFFWKGMRR